MVDLAVLERQRTHARPVAHEGPPVGFAGRRELSDDRRHLRRKWLAAGEMEMKVGAPFELVWRNSELTDPPGKRPEGFGEEHRMQSEITELDPPRKLAFTWGKSGGVSMELEPRGERVLLTVIHRRLPDRGMMVGVSTGWHTHLDMLAARLAGEEPEPFWDGFIRLRKDYDERIPR